MINIERLTKVYQIGDTGVRALDDVSLQIAAGEMVAIMGPSGSGKSTLMNILGCLDSPTSGSYRLLDREIATLTPYEQAQLRNKELGFVFQSFNLLPRLNALQNVELPLIYAGLPQKERRERAVASLIQMGLENRMHHRPQELSGGQQQRVAIARALVNSPRLLLADEPTGNLDSHSSDEIMKIIQGLNREGITMVLVTHETSIAMYTRRIVRFLDGKIVADEIVSPAAGAKEVRV
jgi:putative ABC transport system ATP-binding protein